MFANCPLITPLLSWSYNIHHYCSVLCTVILRLQISNPPRISSSSGRHGRIKASQICLCRFFHCAIDTGCSECVSGFLCSWPCKSSDHIVGGSRLRPSPRRSISWHRLIKSSDSIHYSAMQNTHLGIPVRTPLSLSLDICWPVSL